MADIGVRSATGLGASAAAADGGRVLPAAGARSDADGLGGEGRLLRRSAAHRRRRLLLPGRRVQEAAHGRRCQHDQEIALVGSLQHLTSTHMSTNHIYTETLYAFKCY